MAKMDTDLRYLLILSVILIITISILLLIDLPNPETFTELWLVPNSFPSNASNGEEISFLVGLKNMESGSFDYVLDVLMGDESVGSYHIQLNNGEHETINISFTVPINQTFPSFVEVRVLERDSHVRFRLYGYSNE